MLYVNDRWREIMQVPPQVSAVKVAGARAYERARAGEALDLAARPLTVERLTLAECLGSDTAVFEMVCGKGGYVRSIARDLGRRYDSTWLMVHKVRAALAERTGTFPLIALTLASDHATAASAVGLSTMAASCSSVYSESLTMLMPVSRG